MSDQPTVSHDVGHLPPDFILQLSQMLGRVDEDVSDALWFLDVALEPETRLDRFNAFFEGTVHSNLKFQSTLFVLSVF